MRPVEREDYAYRVERLRKHEVGLSSKPNSMSHGGVMEQSSHRQRCLRTRRDEGPHRVSWCRSGSTDRDQEFSDRGDVMEPQMRSGLVERGEEFSNRGDIMEPQMSSRRSQEFSSRGNTMEPQLRSGLIERNQEFSDRVDKMEPKMKSWLIERGQEFSDRRDMEPQMRSGLSEVGQKFIDRVDVIQPHHLNLPTYGQVVQEPQHGYRASLSRDEAGRRYEFFDCEDMYETSGKDVDFNYEYVNVRSVPGHNVNQERDLGLDRQKLPPFDTESAMKYVDLARGPLSVHEQPPKMRFRDEAVHCPDPFLLDKLSAIEKLEREERPRFHPQGVSFYVVPASRSEDLVCSPQPKECLNTSHRISRLNYAPVIQDDKHVSVNIHSRSSTKLRPPLTEYGEDHIYNTWKDYPARHKEPTSYQYDTVSPLRGDDMDFAYPKCRPSDTGEYGHSYERTSFLEQAVHDRRHARGRICMETLTENINDTEFVQRERYVQDLDVPYHSEIPRRRMDYYYCGKDRPSNSCGETLRRSPGHIHDIQMHGDGHPIRLVKRKYISDEDAVGHKLRHTMYSKCRTQDIDYRNKGWEDHRARELLSPESFDDDRCFGKAESTYIRDLKGRVASRDDLLSYRVSSQGQRHLIRPYNPHKEKKVHENPSALKHYDSNQCNRKHLLTKNVWVRGEDELQADSSACANTELPEESLEFKQLVHKFFLSSTKKLNESVATQKRYKEQGRAGGLYCIVCAKSQSKEFQDTRALATHCFMSQKAGLKAKHIGLHKAICVLMGWNSDAPPDGKLWVPVALPAPAALAQKEDLILWPPLVVIHNCSSLATGVGGRKITTTEVVEDFLRGQGFSGGRIKVWIGKPADGSVLLVKFLGTTTGLQDAEKLHYYFLREELGRKDYGEVTSSKGKGINRSNVKGDKVDELLLYGYMGVAEDLDKVDYDTKAKCLIRSKKEIRDFLDAPVV